MRVVVDTNVLVSAALRGGIPEAVILWIAGRPDWTWLVSPEILAEYAAVLSRPKFGLPREIISRWAQMLDSHTTTIRSVPPLQYPPDPTDAKFLACAVAGRADFLVTGDRGFGAARKLLSTTILSASTFKRLVCDALP